MHGVKALICDTSEISPDKGLLIRGISIAQLKNNLPEAVFYLLLTGELPDNETAEMVKKDLKKRSKVPHYVWELLKTLPNDTPPITMLNLAILALERDSLFRRKYTEGIKKEEYWEWILEDSLNLIPNITVITT